VLNFLVFLKNQVQGFNKSYSERRQKGKIGRMPNFFFLPSAADARMAEAIVRLNSFC